MSIISMFYGTLILMFYRDNSRYHLLHIHARYHGEEAVISIEGGAVLDGKMPPKQLKMVQAWIEILGKEQCRFLDIAKGSAAEFAIQTWIGVEIDYT